jgi:hypothetical protein
MLVSLRGTPDAVVCGLGLFEWGQYHEALEVPHGPPNATAGSMSKVTMIVPSSADEVFHKLPNILSSPSLGNSALHLTSAA